jgi:hypothetical protein
MVWLLRSVAGYLTLAYCVPSRVGFIFTSSLFVLALHPYQLCHCKTELASLIGFGHVESFIQVVSTDHVWKEKQTPMWGVS